MKLIVVLQPIHYALIVASLVFLQVISVSSIDMPKDDKSQSPSPPPRSLRSLSKERHLSPAKARSRSRSSELSLKRARSWSPRRDRSFSPRRRNSETFRDTGHAGREYDDRRLHVANLDVDTSKKDMEQVFGKYGPLKEIWLARSVPAFAFVIYRDRLDTLEALRKADRREICGRTIRVTIAHKSYPIERKGFGVDKTRNRFHFVHMVWSILFRVSPRNHFLTVGNYPTAIRNFHFNCL